MIRYGKTLLTQQPDETTDLLIDLCSGTLKSSSASRQSKGQGLTASPVSEANPIVGEASSSSVLASTGAGYLNVLSYGRTVVEGAAAGAAAVLSPIPGVSSVSRKDTVPPSMASDGEVGKSSARSSKHSSREGSLLVEPSPSPPPAASSSKRLTLLSAEAPEPIASSLSSPIPPPSPRPYFAYFVNFPAHFLRFLESVAWTRFHQRVDVSSTSTLTDSTSSNGVGSRASRQKKKTSANSTAGLAPPSYESSTSQTPFSPDLVDQRAIWNTLLELYLLFSRPEMSAAAEFTALSSTTTMTNPKLNKSKALHLIRQADSIPYDPTHALILCSMNDFTDGLVLLWEKLGMYEEVLRFWMDRENLHALVDEKTSTSVTDDPATRASDNVLAHLKLYGPAHPHLYPLVLRFLTSSHALLARHESDLQEVLAKIDELGVMPMLEVVKILGRNGIASVGVIKKWLRDRVKGLRSEVESVSLPLGRWVVSCVYERTFPVSDFSSPFFLLFFLLFTRTKLL